MHLPQASRANGDRRSRTSATSCFLVTPLSAPDWPLQAGYFTSPAGCRPAARQAKSRATPFPRFQDAGIGHNERAEAAVGLIHAAVARADFALLLE